MILAQRHRDWNLLVFGRLIRSVLTSFPLENLRVLVMRHSKCFSDDLLPLARAVNLRHLDIYSCIISHAITSSHEQALAGGVVLDHLCQLKCSFKPQQDNACLS